jgi:hypothetical protein
MKSRAKASLRTAALLLLVGGCAGTVEEVHEFDVGTGSWRFEALEDGAPVSLVRGAQGGWHVWVSVRAKGVQDGDVLVLETQPADESRPPQIVELTPNFDPENSSGYRNYVGWPAILDNPECLVGELLRIRATLTMGGEEFTAEHDVMVMPGADPPGACVAGD